MLHILLLTLLFLFCKAINNATITHLTLALLPVLAAVNIIDGSLIAFLNHIIISLTSLMIADLASKTALPMHQPSNTVTKASNTNIAMKEPSAILKIPGMSIQKQPSIDTSSAENTTTHPLTSTINTLKNRPSNTTPTPTATPSQPNKETTMPIPDYRSITAADRVASLKKSLNANTPIKPVRETDPDSPFHIPAKARVRRRSRAQ